MLDAQGSLSVKVDFSATLLDDNKWCRRLVIGSGG